MSLFSFLKKNKENYSLVFNIGSGSISGGIIKFTEKTGVEMVYYANESISFQQTVSVNKHIQLMKSSLTDLAKKIQTDGLKKLTFKNIRNIKIERVFFMFSSPWSVSHTKVIRVRENRAIKINDSYLSKIIDDSKESFQTDISKPGVVIEKKIVQIKANGSIINKVNGTQAKDVELSIFFTVVPEEIITTVKDSISKVFNIKNIWCHSLSLAIFSNIRNLFPKKNDFAHIDISEEITDVSIIKDNVILGSASIPFGRNHFIREISAKLRVSEEIADSMIKIHTAKDNNELAALNLSLVIDKSATFLVSKITEVLNNFNVSVLYSEPIFLVARNDLALLLKEKLHRKDFEITILDNKKIRPAIIGNDTIYKLELMFLDELYKI